MMNDERQTDNATNEKDSRKFLLLLLLLLLLLVAVTYILLTCRVDMTDQGGGEEQPPVTQPAGERFEFSAFYHAADGEWIIHDEGILILKEQKYISPSEKEEYTVHEVASGERVKILRADQRWKFVETVPPSGTDKPIRGWIDAHHVRRAGRVFSKITATAPASQKARKQQYPH